MWRHRARCWGCTDRRGCPQGGHCFADEADVCVKHPIVAVCMSDTSKVLSESREEKLVGGVTKAVAVGLLWATHERKCGLSRQDIHFFYRLCHQQSVYEESLQQGRHHSPGLALFPLCHCHHHGLCFLDCCAWFSCLSLRQEERGGGDEVSFGCCDEFCKLGGLKQ